MREDGSAVATLTISARVLDALRFARSQLDAPADGATLEVGASQLTLTEASVSRLMDILASRPLRVDAQLPRVDAIRFSSDKVRDIPDAERLTTSLDLP